MPRTVLGMPADPDHPDYVFAGKPLVKVYQKRSGDQDAANLFLGEWMKLLDDKIPAEGRTFVRYRGGRGYVDLSDLTTRRHLEIFFIDVSQGDGILIQTPDDRRILIDAGKSADTHEFIRNKYRLDKRDNYIDFEAVIATHSDDDHTKGLPGILTDPKIAVKRFYHNGLFRREERARDPGPREGGRVSGLLDRPDAQLRPKLTALMRTLLEAVDQAEANLPEVVKKMQALGRKAQLPPGGFVCKRLDAADRHLPPYDHPDGPLLIEVLWPRAATGQGEPSYAWYGDAGKTVNGNSVVLRVLHGRHKILLTGDLNERSMADLLQAYPAGPGASHPLEAQVYKAAHHGSQDFSLEFLKAVKPDAAVISSGDDRLDVYGHPRAVLLGTITRYSRCERPAVFATELAACFTKLSKEEQAKFKAGTTQLYERSIQGIVHLRSDGDRLCLGTVFGRRMPRDRVANTLWKWDCWAAG